VIGSCLRAVVGGQLFLGRRCWVEMGLKKVDLVFLKIEFVNGFETDFETGFGTGFENDFELDFESDFWAETEAESEVEPLAF